MSSIEKLHGLNKSTDVIMKRGVVDAPALNDWLKQGRRKLTIELQSEEHRIVARWILHQAKPVKHEFGDPTAPGTDAVIAELVLSCERIESEEC